MACAAGRSVYVGLAKRGHCGANRAPRDEPVGIGLDGLVRAVFVGCGVQLLEVAVSSPLFWFLGAVSSAVASAFFWVLARRAGDSGLARATAVAVVVCCAAAFYLGSQL
jgi:hypothetical protein